MRNFGQLVKGILAVSLMATGFAACSNDSGDNDPKDGSRFLTLSINTKGVMRGTNINTDPTTEDDINILAVGIFNAAGDAVAIEEFTSTTWTATSTGLQVTLTTQGLADGNKVIAVANAPTGTFTGCADINAFKAKSTTIDDALASGNAEKTAGFLMVGNSTVSAAGTGYVNFTADITLYHLVAKVTLSPITIDFSDNKLYPSATFTPEEIFLYQVPATKALWYTPQPASAYYGGESTVSGKKEFLGTGATTIDIAKTHIFYTLPNADTGDHATKLVIKGTFKATASAAGTTIYYPIYLDYNAPATPGAAGSAATGALPGYAAEIGLTARTPKVVYANDNYKIGVTIKSIGATSPDSDLDPQEVTVSVTVAPWTDLNQTATFN